jgi:lipopolysaccharide export system protein LptA
MRRVSRLLPPALMQQVILLLLFLPLLLPMAAWGLSDDRNQPMHIEADRASLNEKTGISTYEGNVHVQQGTLNLRGDQMTVQLSNNSIESIVLTGNLATLVQRPDGKDTDQHAEAGRIEYYTTDDRVILLDKARIWQSGSEELRSDRIVFNLKDNTVNAGSNNNDGRVHITLQPKKKPDDKQPPPEQ